jgi:hypothetical protein
MTSLVTALRWIARLDFLVALILGILLWTGSTGYLRIHILTGFIMTITLLLIGLMGFFARIKPVLPIVAIVWAILLPYVGFAQLKVMPGASFITIQIVHLLIGICAIGVVEACGANITRSVSA